MTWHGTEPPEGTGARTVALSFYLALMTATCLRLAGALGPTIVEGPFAANTLYLAMLGAATGRPVLHSTSATGTSIGAALLFGSAKGLISPEKTRTDINVPTLRNYAARWNSVVAETGL